jgi:hypothetical protein
MNRAALLLFLALSVIAAPAFAAPDIYLLGFTGYDYQSPNPDPGTYLTIGEGYSTLGFVTLFGAYLASSVNTTTNEYTYHYYDLAVQSYYFDGDYLEVAFAGTGRGRFFEDSHTTGTQALYDVDPPSGTHPNPTAPSTFIDGTLILGGQLDNLMLTYDYVAMQGGFVGNLRLDEGTLLGQIPLAQRNGWTLAGLAGRLGNPAVPDGYDHQISGECSIPGSVPAEHRTWGALKALYR